MFYELQLGRGLFLKFTGILPMQFMLLKEKFENENFMDSKLVTAKIASLKNYH